MRSVLWSFEHGRPSFDFEARPLSNSSLQTKRHLLDAHGHLLGAWLAVAGTGHEPRVWSLLLTPALPIRLSPRTACHLRLAHICPRVDIGIHLSGFATISACTQYMHTVRRIFSEMISTCRGILSFAIEAVQGHFLKLRTATPLRPARRPRFSQASAAMDCKHGSWQR